MNASHPSSSPDPVAETPLTHEQRMALVQAAQRRACQHRNPVAANLGVLNSDVMRLSHLQGERFAKLTADLSLAEPRSELAREVELTMQLLRSIERTARLEEEIVAKTDAPANDQLGRGAKKSRY